LSPQISYLCPTKVYTFYGYLMSLIIIVLSRDPEQSKLLLQASDPTRPVWPWYVLIHFNSWVSHIYTSPENVPILIMLFLGAQLTDVTWSVKPRSHSLVTLLVFAYHK